MNNLPQITQISQIFGTKSHRLCSCTIMIRIQECVALACLTLRNRASASGGDRVITHENLRRTYSTGSVLFYKMNKVLKCSYTRTQIAPKI